jgi:methionyl-tRNA formyltransferase
LNLRCVFFGTSEFALPSLRVVADASEQSLVITQPDRPAGRGRRIQPTPVRVEAERLGLAVLTPEHLVEVREALAAHKADLFVVASYGKILPRWALALPSGGALNVHPSLLPLYRGATPLQAQLRDGVREGGVSIIVMDEGMDTGDLVLQERSAISASENYGELHDRFAALGAVLLSCAIRTLGTPTFTCTPQAAMGVAESEIVRTLTRPFAKEDLKIDWNADPKAIVDLVRSFAPSPGARAEIETPGGVESVKILRARLPDDGENRDALLWPCGRPPQRGFVALELVVPPGRAPMSGAEFARMLERRRVEDRVP